MTRRNAKVLASLVLSLAALLLAPPAQATSRLGAKQLREIGIDQKLGERVPLDLQFRDHRGETVTLKRYVSERPVVLALIYNRCPMLCNQVLSGLVSALKVLKLDAGSDFDVLAVSFDPAETPELSAANRDKLIERYGRAGAAEGIHFLTGEPEPIRRLTDAVGFRYRYDEEQKQYAHASAIMVLTPGGKLARYFYGTEFSPRDMRLAIVEASDGKVGSLSDDLLLLCYRYDPETGTYSATAINAIRFGGVATLAVLGVFIGTSLRRERRQRRKKKKRREGEP
jgi:protein SCO1/2